MQEKALYPLQLDGHPERRYAWALTELFYGSYGISHLETECRHRQRSTHFYYRDTGLHRIFYSNSMLGSICWGDDGFPFRPWDFQVWPDRIAGSGNDEVDITERT